MTKLRSPEQSELKAVSDLCLRSKAHWGYDANFLRACREELTVTQKDLATDLVTLAVDGAKITGVAQVSVSAGNCHLEKLFVDPAHMGKGIGRRLFAWAARKARLGHASCMIVEADPDAVPFYKTMGCVESGSVPSGSVPGRHLPRLVFETGET